MLLRDHPLMTYRGLRHWPPAWSCTDGNNQHPKGEIGTLKAIFRSDMQPPNRCFLLISYEGSEYRGCLLFDDQAFCQQAMELLKTLAIVPLPTSVAWMSVIFCKTEFRLKNSSARVFDEFSGTLKRFGRRTEL